MERIKSNRMEGYQLRIWLRHISPMIWRRVVISDHTNIKDLHIILQIIMGWSDVHLNSFTIQGKIYGVPHSGGMCFSDNPADVTLHQLGLRKNEKFMYEYDFTDGWQHEIRVEKIMQHDNVLPARCIGGSRTAPPEECGDPLAYMQLLDRYNPAAILWELAEIIEDIRGHTFEEDEASEIIDRLQTLLEWYDVEQFSKTKINQRLKYYFEGDERWRDSDEA